MLPIILHVSEHNIDVKAAPEFRFPILTEVFELACSVRQRITARLHVFTFPFLECEDAIANNL